MGNKGVTISCSMIENDGQYKVGFNYKDSNGLEFDNTYEGEDPEEMIEDLFDDVLNEIVASQLEPTQEEEKSEEEVEKDAYIIELEKMIAKLQEDNKSLKTDIDILQRRADDAVNKSLNNKKDYVNGFNNILSQDDPFRKVMRLWF